MAKTALAAYTSRWICPHGHETEVYLVHVVVSEDGVLERGVGGSAWDFCDGAPGPDGYCSDYPSDEQRQLCSQHIASQVMAERGRYSEEYVAEQFAAKLREVSPCECSCRDSLASQATGD